MQDDLRQPPWKGQLSPKILRLTGWELEDCPIINSFLFSFLKGFLSCLCIKVTWLYKKEFQKDSSFLFYRFILGVLFSGLIKLSTTKDTSKLHLYWRWCTLESKFNMHTTNDIGILLLQKLCHTYKRHVWSCSWYHCLK